MAGKAINQHDAFSGNASDVNILVQETSQNDPTTYKHKKANLQTIVNTMKGVNNGLAGLGPDGKVQIATVVAEKVAKALNAKPANPLQKKGLCRDESCAE